ncbi:MAG TPA: undecaprenyl-diphosphatase, partial [Firmicutes bacterium]|nr:undecaprenyl-diphosphatase [Bacillota bacterium]
TAELLSLAVGFLVSFLVALAVIDRFIAYLKRKPMRVFAYYRMIFALIVLGAGFSGLFA